MTTLGLATRNPRDILGWLDAHEPTNPSLFVRRNLPRSPLADSAGDTNHGALTTQVMTNVAVPLAEGDLITNIKFVSGNTAADTPTNWWVALYDTAGVKMAQSADQTSTAIAAKTAFGAALATAQRITKSGLYRVGLMVKATAVPTLLGALGAPSMTTGEPTLAQSSGSSLTDTAPATIATPTAKLFVPYVELT